MYNHSPRHKHLIETYLRDNQPTFTSFAFNASSYLRTVRGQEVKDCAFEFTDKYATEFQYHGHPIAVSSIKAMVEGHLVSFQQELERRLFFGEPVPLNMFPDIELENIVDDNACSNPGYSFLSDARNGFAKYGDRYGRWLFARPGMLERFIYPNTSVWKTDELMEWLREFHYLQEMLAVGLLISGGPSCRATEFGSLILRNSYESPRSVRMSFKALTLVNLHDKTSHQRGVDRYIPHVPTREWADQVIKFLVTIRPFAEFAIVTIFGRDSPEDKSYQSYLWPKLNKHLSGDAMNEQLSSVTLEYLGQEYSVLWWRNGVTFMANVFAPNNMFNTQVDTFVDIATMHTTSSAIARYGGYANGIPGTDPRMMCGVMLSCIAFQQFVKIGQKRPLYLGSAKDDQPAPPTGGPASESSRFLPSIQTDFL